MLSKYSTGFKDSNIILSDPDQEVHAQLQIDFDKQYLDFPLANTLNTLVETPKPISLLQTTKAKLVRTKKSKFGFTTQKSIIPPAPALKKRDTGTSIMSFFQINQFIQRMRRSKLVQKNLNMNHLRLINDQSCDNYKQLQIKDVILNKIRIHSLFLREQHEITQTFYQIVVNQISLTLSLVLQLLKRIPQFHPESRGKITWDYWTTITRFLLLILIPLEITYQPHIIFDKLLPLIVFLQINIFLDLLIRLNTVCYEKGQAVNDRLEIFNKTVRGTMILDLALLAPLLYFSIFNYDTESHISVLFTVFGQLYYIEQIIHKSEQSSYFSKTQKGIFNLMQLIMTLLYIVHIFACLWYWNAKLSPGGWITTHNLIDQGWEIIYLEAFYFGIVTMLTIGYGDNVPISWNEKLVTIVFILVACLWFSYIINTIGNIIYEINFNKVERNKKLRIINRYMSKRKIPFSLQYKIREYVNFKWKQEEDIDLQLENALLDELSDELKEDLEAAQHAVFVGHSDYIRQNYSLEFQAALKPIIQRVIIEPQSIFSINKIDQTEEPHLCFIEQGQILYYNEFKNILNTTLTEQFVEVQDFLIYNDKTQQFKAIGYVSLLVIKKSDFLRILQKFPLDHQKYQHQYDINLQNSNSLKLTSGIFCPACISQTHSLNTCPQLNLRLDRELIIKRHQNTQFQDRLSYKRVAKGPKNSINAIRDQDIIEQFVVFFQQSQPQLVEQQIAIQLVSEEAEEQKKKEVHNSQSNSNLKSSSRFFKQSSLRLSVLSDQSLIKADKGALRRKAFNRSPSQMQFLDKVSEVDFGSDREVQIQEVIDPNDLDNTIQANIALLYNKVCQAEDPSIFDPKLYTDIEMLYLKLKNSERIDLQFDTVRNYENFHPQNNVDNVLSSVYSKTQITTFTKRLLNFMNYPYDYVNKYQKVKTLTNSNKAPKPVKRQSWLLVGMKKMNELKTRLTKRKLASSNIELHAYGGDVDYDKQYLEYCLYETKREIVHSRTPSQHAADCLDTVKDSPQEVFLFNEPQKKTVGSNFMSCFVLRRFLQKIQYRRNLISQLNKTHINLISDLASDSQSLLEYTKSQSKGEIKFTQLTSLFKIQTQQKKNAWIEFKNDLQKLQTKSKQRISQIIQKIPLIKPESFVKMIWDYIILIFRIILLIIAPLDIGFATQFIYSSSSLTTVLIIMILLDLFFRTNTECYVQGKALQDRWEILIYELQNSFIGDGITVLILIIFVNYSVQNNLNFFLLFCFYQYRYIHSIFAKSEQTSFLTKPQKGIVGLAKFILSLLYIIHLFSCIWFWISSIYLNTSWISGKGLQDETWDVQYLEAFYFAIVTMLTIGYGDNVPRNSIEKITTIIFILGACLWFSYSINFIGNLINDITLNQVERNKRIRVLNKYMEKRNIPYSLQYQIKEYLTYRWKEDDETDLSMEEILLNQLSDDLKEKIEEQANHIFIEKSKLLQKYFSQEFTRTLAKSIKRKIIQPQNTFTILFNESIHLCFIEQGDVAYQHQDPKQRSKMHSVFHSGEFLNVQNFITESTDFEAFKAVGYVSLLTLSKSDFIRILKDFPKDHESYQQLKDSLVLAVPPQNIPQGVYCPCCMIDTHSLKQCPMTQFIPDRELIIKKLNFVKPQTRKYFQRSTKRKQQGLSDKQYLEEFTVLFQQENHQIIQVASSFSNMLDDDKQINSNQNVSISECQIESPDRQLPIIRVKPEINQQQRQPPAKSQSRTLTVINKQPYMRKSTLMWLDQDNIAEEQLKTQFHQTQQDNISKIYQNILNKRLMNQDFTNEREFRLIESLHLRNRHTNHDLDVVQNYQNYFSSQNVQCILFQFSHNNTVDNWQQKLIARFIKYTYYPYQYINKYLTLKRNKSYLISQKTVNTMSKVKSKLKIIQLRNSFLQKKISSMKNIRLPQVAPTTKSSKFI